MHKISTNDKYCFFPVNAEGEIYAATRILFGCTKEEAMAEFKKYKDAVTAMYPGHTVGWMMKDQEADLSRANEKIEALEAELREERGENDED